MRFVWPRVREALLPRRIHLVDVDLRWRVTSEQDAQAVCRVLDGWGIEMFRDRR